MRYFVTGEQNRQLLLNTVVLLFMVYMLVLWVSIGLMYFHKMNLTADSVVAYYLGSEANFTEPRSYQSLLLPVENVLINKTGQERIGCQVSQANPTRYVGILRCQEVGNLTHDHK